MTFESHRDHLDFNLRLARTWIRLPQSLWPGFKHGLTSVALTRIRGSFAGVAASSSNMIMVAHDHLASCASD